MSRTTRKPFTKSKAVDSSCRSHGSCPWCGASRKYRVERQTPIQDEDIALMVRWWLRQNFLTMKDAAKDLNVSSSYLSQVQSGKKLPSRELLDRIGVGKTISYEIK